MCSVGRSRPGVHSVASAYPSPARRAQGDDQQLPAAETLMPRMNVQAHDVTGPLWVVVGILGRSELAKPGDTLIADQRHDAASGPGPHLAVLGPVAGGGSRVRSWASASDTWPT